MHWMQRHLSICLSLVCSLIAMISCVSQAQELASVESLPLDKFDEYLPADTLPHPWQTYGQFKDDLSVLSQTWAESHITGNIISGKGVEILDQSLTDGQGIGFGMNFTQPPVGPIMFTFDIRLNKRAHHSEDMKLAITQGRDQTQPIHMYLSVKDGMQIKTANGVMTKLSELEAHRWYHVAILGNTQSVDVKIAVTPHPSANKIGYPNIGQPAAYVDYQLAQAWGQPTDVRFVIDAPAKAIGAWNIDNVCVLGDVTADRQSWWPFKPDLSEKIKGKRVFSYYFPPFSANRATKDSKLNWPYVDDPTLSWVFWSWLNFTNDLDYRRWSSGSKMQYIAYTRVPVPGQDRFEAKALEMTEEVKLGQMMGMDGFIMDFNVREDHDEWNWLNSMSTMLEDAAANTQGAFGIIPAVYGASKKDGVNGEGDQGYPAASYASSKNLRNALKHPGAFRTDDGKSVLSMWLTEKHSPKWWSDVLANLQQDGIPTALFAQFNSTSQIKGFSDVAMGMTHWGPRTPTEYGWFEAARPYAKILGYPIVSQDVRTRGSQVMGESQNTRTLRKLWDDAITKNADWAIINTWSDYTEHAQMPSTAIGYTYYDLNAYYTHSFKTGKQPTITKDALYYIYRRQHTDAPQLHGVRWRVHGGETNNIELLAFLKTPGTLLVKIDGKEYRQNALAGITSFMVPIPQDKRFVPYFAVERDGKETLGDFGRYTIYEKVDYPNLLYHSGVIVK
jgi:hypothetical protein